MKQKVGAMPDAENELELVADRSLLVAHFHHPRSVPPTIAAHWDLAATKQRKNLRSEEEKDEE